MRLLKFLATAVVALSGALGAHGAANAADVLCKDASLNHMLVSDAYVSTCIDAGLGNIGQGGGNDVFLNANLGYTLISQYFTFDADDWSIPANSWSGLAPGESLFIGFKFGTQQGTPDEWFVYSLQDAVVSGTYTFVGGLQCQPGGATQCNGGLSHLALYKGPGDGGGDDDEIPEPASLALLGLGLLALAGTRRRKS